MAPRPEEGVENPCFLHSLPLARCCWLSLAVLAPSVKPQQTIHRFEIRPPPTFLEAFPVNARKPINADVLHTYRYERGGFSGGGGGNRWGEDSRDEDWSKRTAPNERLEQ